jgi:hypothetical protein
MVPKSAERNHPEPMGQLPPIHSVVIEKLAPASKTGKENSQRDRQACPSSLGVGPIDCTPTTSPTANAIVEFTAWSQNICAAA